jgi:membrane-bound metal-dependent hydrolase YbcI (DUF457 family)
MFVGHFALGFAAKRTAPRVPLALLFLAAQLADTLWPILIAAGVEQVRIEQNSNPFLQLVFISYPYSHSLLLLAIWGIALAAIYRAASSPRESAAASVVLFALVVSHWVLDWITHRPDMPLYPGGPTFGLGLWNSVVATVCVELVMFGVGVWIYARATRARDAVGRWALVGLGALLLLAYLASLGGSAPPSVAALATVALIGAAITFAMAWWVDRQRVTV